MNYIHNSLQSRCYDCRFSNSVSGRAEFQGLESNHALILFLEPRNELKWMAEISP